MTAGVKPENPQTPKEAKEANRQAGYGPNNPEPMQFHITSDTATEAAPDALHAAQEYIEHKQ